MDPKDIFEKQSKRPLGPMEPTPTKSGILDSVEEALFERLPLPIKDPLPRAIEFRRKTGSWFSFPYHCLMGVEYVPHSRITLNFATHIVTVSGRNLKQLYDGLRRQTAETIEEVDRAMALAAGDDEPSVREISVARLGDCLPLDDPPPAFGSSKE